MTNVHLLKIEEMGSYNGARTRYTFKELNNKKENIVVELGYCDGNSSLVKIWKQKKYVKDNLKSYINIDVYVTDEKNNCYSKYNPQITKTHKINFDYIFEDTKANRCKILTKIAELAYNTNIDEEG